LAANTGLGHTMARQVTGSETAKQRAGLPGFLDVTLMVTSSFCAKPFIVCDVVEILGMSVSVPPFME
jgi:hypothetical protein